MTNFRHNQKLIGKHKQSFYTYNQLPSGPILFHLYPYASPPLTLFQCKSPPLYGYTCKRFTVSVKSKDFMCINIFKHLGEYSHCLKISGSVI